MKKIAVPTLVMLALIPLPGCQTSPQQTASDQAYCQSIGATGNGLAQCVIYKDQARRADISRRLRGLSDLAAQDRARYPAPRAPSITTTRCHANPGTNSVDCTTM